MSRKNRKKIGEVYIKLGRLKGKLQHLFHKAIYLIYYKLLFGRQSLLTEQIGTFVNSWEKRRYKGDIPVSKEIWISQYQEGNWDFMKDLSQLARYAIIAGYIKYFDHTTEILDIGCGEGILREHLDSNSYSRYVGIDISDAAIRHASRKEDHKTSFFAENAADFIPEEKFDTVIFNESLYYFDDPIEIIKKYEQHVNRGGIFITSMFANSIRAMATLNLLKANYTSIDEVTIMNGPKKWVCNIFYPGLDANVNNSDL